MCLPVKAHFDLLHLRTDTFYYKSGTLGVIWPVSQEAISKRGGGGRVIQRASKDSR